MKKLMIMLAAVAMAVGAQAASVNWTCTYVYNGNETQPVSGVAYFLTTDMLSYDAAQGLAGKGADAITAALGSAYSYQGTDGSFTVKSANAVANATLGLKDGSDYTAYLMIFNAATVEDATGFYLTTTKSLSTYSGADDSVKVSWGNQYDNTIVAGNWAAVPEPTSGLLMLVGLAGLALRRRRA